jgi:hypothetical protein
VVAKSPISDAQLANVFSSYPDDVRDCLLTLRALILEVAGQTEGVGRVEEALRWGQPSYLTPETRSGTTIRIDGLEPESGKYALFVHCQTSLIESFKERYGETLQYDGNRALIFEVGQELPTEALAHCIEMALTYHLRKRASSI